MMSDSIKSLHIELGRRLLGGTMQVYYLTSTLYQRGFPVALVCPKASPLHQKARSAGVQVHALPYWGDFDLRLPFKLIPIIGSFKPDIIHIHSRRGADTLGLIAARMTGKAKVIITRRVDNPIKDSFLNRIRYRKLPDLVLSTSHGIKQAMVQGGVPEKEIGVVHSAIDASLYQVDADQTLVRSRLGIPRDATVLCTIAQLIERKGHRFLFQAGQQIFDRFPDTCILLLGEGELETSLKKYARSLGIEEKVIFAGYRKNVGEILNTVDILVHPATMEGFANVALQAMAASIPVVSTAVGGMPESVRDGINGLLVPPEDPHELARAIIKLIENPQMRSTFGQRGKEIVESEFTVEKMVDGNLSHYQCLLGQLHSVS